MVWAVLTLLFGVMIWMVIADALRHEERNARRSRESEALVGPGGSRSLRTARQALRVERNRLSTRLATADGQATREAADLCKEIVDLNNAIEALDVAISERWVSVRTSTVLSAISALIAAMALLGTFFNAYSAQRFQRNSKQIDAAVAWCKEMSQPSFIAYQQNARLLRAPLAASPMNLYRIRDEDKDPSTATLKTPEDIAKHLRDEGAVSDKTREDVTASLVGLLNYIEIGAEMVARGDMEPRRYLGCFEGFKTAYFERYDNSYIGRVLALQATPPGAKLHTAETFFDKTACVFDPANRDDPTVCDKGK